MASFFAMSRFSVKVSRLEHFIYMNISRTIYSISQHCISTGTNIRIYAMFRILDPGAVPLISSSGIRSASFASVMLYQKYCGNESSVTSVEPQRALFPPLGDDASSDADLSRYIITMIYPVNAASHTVLSIFVLGGHFPSIPRTYQ